ncbi:methyltransferase domain-containing protein [soil metagenome]
MRPTRPIASAGTRATLPVEIAVAPGLADVAADELQELARRLGRGTMTPEVRDDAIALRWPGTIDELHTLRTAASLSRVWRFDVPRPKALLGDALLRALATDVGDLVRAAPAPFHALRLSAAGRDSDVMRRFADVLASSLSLRVDHEGGDLLVRVRRAQDGAWEVLVRTTPRPMSVRAWRTCDRRGGLDGAFAAAAVRLARPRPTDRVLGAMVGSGTLLIERALVAPAERLDGVDIDAEAVACTLANAASAGAGEHVHVWRGDVTALDVPAAAFDLILVDPPWGDAVGSNRTNPTLYEGMLIELGRIAAPGARLVLVTHEVRLTERLLEDHPLWSVVHARRAWHGGHQPLLCVLRRNRRRSEGARGAMLG